MIAVAFFYDAVLFYHFMTSNSKLSRHKQRNHLNIKITWVKQIGCVQWLWSLAKFIIS